jgi:hypothetical protein
MYEWLEQEIAEIRTNKFHRVDGPAGAKLRRAVQSTRQPAPASYREFVLKFGNADLYRQDELDLYYITVYASLREWKTKEGQVLWLLGRHNMHFACFQDELLSGAKESPVFERIEPSGYMQPVADAFQAWLEDRARCARKRYGKRRWAEIVRGPEPLTPFERQIVEARRRYRWRATGVTKNGDIEFEVHNGSEMVLPYLSIGIDDEDGVLGGGGAFLPVGKIKPGETRIIAFDCYKDIVPPERIKPFALPDPGPEDRAFYWEFRASWRPTAPKRSSSPRKKK